MYCLLGILETQKKKHAETYHYISWRRSSQHQSKSHSRGNQRKKKKKATAITERQWASKIKQTNAGPALPLGAHLSSVLPGVEDGRKGRRGPFSSSFTYEPQVYRILASASKAIVTFAFDRGLGLSFATKLPPPPCAHICSVRASAEGERNLRQPSNRFDGSRKRTKRTNIKTKHERQTKNPFPSLWSWRFFMKKILRSEYLDKTNAHGRGRRKRKERERENDRHLIAIFSSIVLVGAGQ